MGLGNRISQTGGVMKAIGSPSLTTDENPCLRGLSVLAKPPEPDGDEGRAKGMNSLSANRPAPGPLLTPGHAGDACCEAYQNATSTSGSVRHYERAVDHSSIQAAHPTDPEKPGSAAERKRQGPSILEQLLWQG